MFLKYVIIGILLLVFGPAAAQEPGAPSEDEKEFSRAECRWAAKWINREMAFMMGNGVLKKVISKEKLFEVQVAAPWYELEFNQQGDFLKNLSRSREITGHKPFFNVKDPATDSVVARVTDQAIEIEVPAEGFFHFLYSDTSPRNTHY